MEWTAQFGPPHPPSSIAIILTPHDYLIDRLRVKKAEHWGEKVEIVHEDMRRWKAPELADILVSELLGSFGDNELSPECLDGAQAFLKGKSIYIGEA